MISRYYVYILSLVVMIHVWNLSASAAAAAASCACAAGHDSRREDETGTAARYIPESPAAAGKSSFDFEAFADDLPDEKVPASGSYVPRAAMARGILDTTQHVDFWRLGRSSRKTFKSAAQAAAGVLSMHKDATEDFFDTPLAPHPTGMSLKRAVNVLCLDGGGIRGVRHTEILAALERRTRSELKLPLVRVFDVMAGTSTGAGIVAALSLPGDSPSEPKMTAEKLKSLYSPENARRIFHAGLGHSICNCWGLTGSRYPDSGITQVLTEYIGTDTWLSEIPSNVLITSVSLDTENTKFFRSDRARDDTREDYTLFDAVKASAAAPTFLPSHTVTNRSGAETLCIDGGVQMNNPSLAAYELTRELYGSEAEINIFSIGTGESASTISDPASLHRAGKIGWARPVLDLSMRGNAFRTHEIMQKLLPPPPIGSDALPHYLRTQFTYGAELSDMSSSDPAVIEAVRRSGDPELNPEVKAMIDTFMKILKKQFSFPES